jgi:hypothetical protein
MRQRRERVEHSFGTIKVRMGATQTGRMQATVVNSDVSE